MANPVHGEVWLVDLGIVAKVRPCLILGVAAEDKDRALATLLPHTTSVRGSNWEVPVAARFLRPGAFDAQNLTTIPLAKMLRRLGALSDADLKSVEDAVRNWLGL